MWPGNLMENLKNNRAPPTYYVKLYANHFKAIGEFKLELQPGNAQFGSKLVIFFIPCGLKIWRMTLKITGHIFSVTSRFMHHFIANYQFKMGLQSESSKFGSNRQFLVPCDLEIWWTTLKNKRAPLLCYFKLCALFHSHLWDQNEVTVWKHQIWVKIGDFFVPCDLEIFQMTLKNNRVPLLCYFKLCASFHSHLCIQNGVTVRKRSILVKIGNFLFRVTLQFDGWPWKTIEHHFYAISSFVHHFMAICEFKLELQAGTQNLGQNWRFFVPCDLEILRMTVKNNRASLLCYFKLCASFHSHLWIQTGVTVRKRLSWVLTSVTLTFDLELLHGYHFCHW